MQVTSLDLPLRNLFYYSGTGTKAVLVIMHGLGDSLESYRDFPGLIGLEEMSYLLLNAPEPYYMGWKWYDLEGDQEKGLRASRELIESAISRLIREFSISKRQVILSGFSQGGVVSLYTGLRSTEPYGGIASLSGYLFGEEKDFSASSREVPVFMAHGEYDELIPYSWVSGQRAYLTQLGYNVSWHSYPITHTISMEEIQDFRNWLLKIL